MRPRQVVMAGKQRSCQSSVWQPHDKIVSIADIGLRNYLDICKEPLILFLFLLTRVHAFLTLGSRREPADVKMRSVAEVET